MTPGATTRMVWIVTEVSDGKTTGRRYHESLDDAAATAKTWVSQSAGDVTISRREVPA